MRILTDENVPRSMVQALRNANHDTATASELGLSGRPDIDLLLFCNQNGRILVTNDKDFGRLLVSGSLRRLAKVVLLRYTTVDLDRIGKEVVEFLGTEAVRLAEASWLLAVLSEGRYRLRRSETNI